MASRVVLPNWCSELTESRFIKTTRRDGDEVRGFVVAVGRKWIVLRHTGALDLDGLVALRISDLTSFEPDTRYDDVVLRSLNSRNITLPEPIVGMQLDSTADAVESMSKLGKLIAVHPDRRWPGTCHLGRLSGVDRAAKKLRLLEVDPGADWDSEPTTWRLQDIRRIDVGDAYGENIAILAGEPIANPLKKKRVRNPRLPA
jgi:hypothetical protein